MFLRGWKLYDPDAGAGTTGDAGGAGSAGSGAGDAGSAGGGGDALGHAGGGAAGGSGGGTADLGAGGQTGAGAPGAGAPGATGSGGVPGAGSGAAAPVSPALAGLLHTARERFGVDLSKYQSDEAALQGLLHAQSLVGRRSQEAELGRYYRDHADEFRAFLELKRQGSLPAPQQQQAAGQQQQQAESWWNPPRWDDSWNRYLTQDADGNVRVAEGAPPEVQRTINERLQYLESWRHRLLHNPQDAFKGVLESFREELREEFGGQIQTAREIERRSAESQAIVAQNQAWLYQRTGEGRTVYDPTTGRPALTPAGAYYTNQLIRLRDNGVSDQAEMHNIAMALTYAAFAGQQGAAQQQPTTGNGQQNPALPPGATHHRQPTAGATNNGNGAPPVTKGRSLREALMEKSKRIPESEFAV